jgi:hypothetical protein
MFFKKKAFSATSPGLIADSEKAKRAAASRKTWEEAEAALMAFKATRSNQDRELAAKKLMEIALIEVEFTIRNGVKVDQKLPASQRRDLGEMARDAVASVLTQERTRMSVLADNHDPQNAMLRTFIARLLYNKVIDYTRKEPIPGQLRDATRMTTEKGASATPSELRQFSQSLLPPDSSQRAPSSTLAPTAPTDSNPPNGHKRGGAGASAQADSHEDDHSTPELIRQFKAFLPPDEYTIFLCEFHELSDVDGLAYLCKKQGDKQDATGKLVPYMSIATYRRKREQMQAALQERFPEIKW